MASHRKKLGDVSVVPALGDALVDYAYISTQVFLPTRGREFGITRNGLTSMIEARRFPKPIRLSTGKKAALRWRLSDLRKWMETRAA